jgi:hypothetical protein
VNSRWSRAAGLAPVALALCLTAGTACHKKDKGDAARAAEAKAAADPFQADANLLGRELADIMDRVMAYASAHQRRLPGSLRQAGVDSLAGPVVRRYTHAGSTPTIAIVFRRPESHKVASCAGDDSILEDASLHENVFEVTCTLVGGGTRTFRVGPPPPPPPAK